MCDFIIIAVYLIWIRKLVWELKGCFMSRCSNFGWQLSSEYLGMVTAISPFLNIFLALSGLLSQEGREKAPVQEEIAKKTVVVGFFFPP